MEIGIKVGDIMTRDYVSVSPDLGLKECAKKMVMKHVGSLIIEEKGLLKGLLTERDILWVFTKKSGEELNNIKAGDIARKKVTTIKPSEDLYEALKKMRKSKDRWLPVVIKDKVIGFLTIKDILRVEPGLFEIVHSQGAFQIKEEYEKKKRIMTRKSDSIEDGICQSCGNYDLLYNINGKLICENCR